MLVLYSHLRRQGAVIDLAFLNERQFCSPGLCYEVSLPMVRPSQAAQGAFLSSESLSLQTE